jgi:signal transduction histidine kinase
MAAALFLSRLRRRSLMLPVAILAALAVLGINEASYRSSMESLDRLGERGVARRHVENVARRLTDAETAQRGYLLTAREDYLGPYIAAPAEIDASLIWLHRHYVDDAATLALVEEMRVNATEKLSELATTLALFKRDPDGPWRDLVLTDIGREKMDAIRDLSARLQAIESERLAVERSGVYATLRLARLGVSAMLLLSLFSLVYFLRQRRAFDAARQETALALQAERDQLEAKVLQRTAELTELAHHLHTAREDERSSIARNLHDELGALMTAAKFDAARLKRSIGDLSPEVDTRLRHLNDTINKGISLKRRIIEDLRPSALSNLGLVQALEILAREFGERAELPLRTDLQPVRLTDSAQITIYRVVQEALTNIAKYAHATAVEVRLWRDGDRARVSISDDGRGFELTAPRPQSHGLVGMRYRAEGEGGSLRVTSTPGGGTRIDVWLPALPEAPTERVAEPVADAS